MATISEIEDYLSRQESDDPLDSKSRGRVLRQMAESVKENKPLRDGRCNLCGRESERLLPIPMTVGQQALDLFHRYGGALEIKKTYFGPAYCDYSLIKNLKTFLVNPRICQLCSKKIGSVHRFNKQEFTRQRMVDAKKRGGLR